MEASDVLLRESRGAVVQVTLNRPHAMNALNSTLRAALTAFWREFRDSGQWRVAIVTGAGGRAFSSGRDFKETAGVDAAGGRLDYEKTGEYGYPDSLALGKPVIAAVDGHCLASGLRVAIGCDIRIATERSRFGNPQVTRGRGTRMPLDLVCAGLPRAVVMDMVYTGEPITGQRALELGLISRLVTPEQLLPTAWSIAERIAANSPVVVSGVRRATEAGLLDLPMNEAQRLWPLVTGGMMGNTVDAIEGARSFAEKRSAQFS
ncbi:MAG: enoyl-CoA hydratase/isomerase family protein [Burkholderiaceae bacterium]